jgi:hypothetical protein
VFLDIGATIGDAEIAVDKIEWYVTVTTIDCIDLNKKYWSTKFELRGAKNTLAHP